MGTLNNFYRCPNPLSENLHKPRTLNYVTTYRSVISCLECYTTEERTPCNIAKENAWPAVSVCVWLSWKLSCCCQEWKQIFSVISFSFFQLRYWRLAKRVKNKAYLLHIGDLPKTVGVGMSSVTGCCLFLCRRHTLRILKSDRIFLYGLSMCHSNILSQFR